MYTTIALFALTASVTTGNLTPTPTWQADYRTAQATVASASKPMAIFIANGTGWESIVKDGIDAVTKRVLAEKFVCLFVDASTAQGRGVAEAFQVGRGLVISDRTGTVQAYSLAGDLTKAELATTLAKYSDGKAVETTETVLRGSEIVYGGRATGNCSTGTCYTGTCATGTCGSPVYYQGTAPATAPAPAPVAAPVVAAPAPCPTGSCGTTTNCGSARKCGFGGGTRSSCFGGFNKCGFGGGMRSCGGFGGGCSSGGCR